MATFNWPSEKILFFYFYLRIVGTLPKLDFFNKKAVRKSSVFTDNHNRIGKTLKCPIEKLFNNNFS